MSIELSIVIPVFNEEDNIKPLYMELKGILKTLNMDYEIIFVDDGSKDCTFHELELIRHSDERLKLIKLRRNFGKSVALNVAFRLAQGSCIITLDGDLQDDPKEIPRFLEKLNKNYDLVNGWKYDRKDPLSKRLPSLVFNKLSSLLTGVKIHDFNCGFKAYKKYFLDNVHLYGEMHRYIPAIAQWYGFKVTEIKVDHHKRRHGGSKYGLSRIIKGFLDLITMKFLMAYSTRPLHIFGVPGIVSLLAGFLIGLYLILLKYIEGVVLSERPLLLLSILLLFTGLQFISVGLIGELIVARGAKHEDVDIYIQSVS